MEVERDQLVDQETPQKQSEQLSLVQVAEAVELQTLYQMQQKQHQAEVQVVEVPVAVVQRMAIKTVQELAL
jgi:hypothetical protein